MGGSKNSTNGFTEFLQIFFLAGIFAILVFTTFLSKPAPFVPPKYEYHVIFDKNTFEALETIGEGGWEIVSTRYVRDNNDNWGYEFIIKRTIRN